jgi:hypothetical protein
VTRCVRFETEGLLRIEQGLPLDDHFATCAECLEARAAYDRLRSNLSALGRELEPPERWQADVWRAIATRKRPRPWWPWMVGAGLAAGLAGMLLLRPSQQELAVASLRVTVEPSAGTVQRGDEAMPGDGLRLEASTAGAAFAELRVYRNDRELLLRCSGEPVCALDAGRLIASLPLDAVGSYQPLLLVSQHPLPPPASDLDRDTAAALVAGAELALGRKVVVR